MADLEAIVDPAKFDPAGNWAAPPEHWADLMDDHTDKTTTTTNAIQTRPAGHATSEGACSYRPAESRSKAN
jgi:hypothetical protein